MNNKLIEIRDAASNKAEALSLLCASVENELKAQKDVNQLLRE